MDKNIQNMLSNFDNAKEKLNLHEEYNNIIKNGQNPHTLVISCCDSRTDPSLLFNSDFGDIFVLRTIANIIPPYKDELTGCTVAATLEFAIQNLSIKNIVILGHSGCAGIAGLCSMHHKPKNNVEKWLEPMLDSKNIQLKSPDSIKNDVDKQSLKTLAQSRANILNYPKVKDAIDNGKLELHVWFYNMKEKEIFNLVDGIFEKIS